MKNIFSFFVTCIICSSATAQVSTSPPVSVTGNISSGANPEGFPSETVYGFGGNIAEGPGNDTPPSTSGTVTCYVHAFWPSSTLTGAPSSVTVSWYTTDGYGYSYDLRGSGTYPTSGSVSGTASVTEGNQTVYPPYSASYPQQTTEIYGGGNGTSDGEQGDNQTYPTSWTLDPEDGYYYSNDEVDKVTLNASESYIAPTHGDTKGNSISTSAALYFTMLS